MATVCDTKTLYDTEFEAELAVARHDKMKYYRCPGTQHFHITHKEKNGRRGHGYGWGKCPTCNVLMKKKTLAKHNCKG